MINTRIDEYTCSDIESGCCSYSNSYACKYQKYIETGCCSHSNCYVLYYNTIYRNRLLQPLEQLHTLILEIYTDRVLQPLKQLCTLILQIYREALLQPLKRLCMLILNNVQGQVAVATQMATCTIITQYIETGCCSNSNGYKSLKLGLDIPP